MTAIAITLVMCVIAWIAAHSEKSDAEQCERDETC